MQSWEGLLIHAINDTNIDCFKDSDGSLDVERLLCTSGVVLLLVYGGVLVTYFPVGTQNSAGELVV